MTNYQLTVLVNEKVSEADRNGIFDGLKKNFGSLEKEDLWGMRSLSYPIKHADRAYYAHFEFSGEPGSIIGLDKAIRLNEDIIRYLIVKKEAKRRKYESRKISENLEAKVEVVEEKTEGEEPKKKKVYVKVKEKKLV